MCVIHILHPQSTATGGCISMANRVPCLTLTWNRGLYTQPRHPNRCQDLAHSCYWDRTSSVESQAQAVVNNMHQVEGMIYIIYIYYMLFTYYMNGCFIMGNLPFPWIVLDIHQLAWSIMSLILWNIELSILFDAWDIQLTGLGLMPVYPTRWYDRVIYSSSRMVRLYRLGGWWEFWNSFLPSTYNLFLNCWWFFTNPFEKICSSKHGWNFPRDFGWGEKSKKYVSCHHRSFWTVEVIREDEISSYSETPQVGEIITCLIRFRTPANYITTIIYKHHRSLKIYLVITNHGDQKINVQPW